MSPLALAHIFIAFVGREQSGLGTNLDLVQTGRNRERAGRISASEAFITSVQTGSAMMLPNAPR